MEILIRILEITSCGIAGQHSDREFVAQNRHPGQLLSHY
jgi:hypothetical protein